LAFTVLLDANVLYPAYLRDVLLRLAYAGVYQVRWTDQILHEMARNMKERVPEDRHNRVDRIVAKLNEAFPEARVTGYESLIQSMTNHPKDRHVLAAAVQAGADLIVTCNVKDFPYSACEPYDIDVQPPDEFLCYQWELRSPEYLTAILEQWASSLSNPPLTLEQLLQEHAARRVPEFGEAVLRFVRSRT
jgi:predicted nucleic acid-binding protein